jgi:hypothetical protein
VALLILRAGCSDAEFVRSPGSPSADASGPNVWEPYQFTAGESFTYEVTERDRLVGTFSWEVLDSHANGTVTIRTSGTIEGESFESTATGPREDVYAQMLRNPAGSYATTVLLSPIVSSFSGESLAVGQGWEYTNGPDSVSYDVERTDTIAGREVFVTVSRENGVPVYEAWIDPEMSLAAKTVTYEQGQVDVELALTDYSP